jgi:hypothetical protein
MKSAMKNRKRILLFIFRNRILSIENPSSIKLELINHKVEGKIGYLNDDILYFYVFKNSFLFFCGLSLLENSKVEIGVE